MAKTKTLFERRRDRVRRSIKKVLNGRPRLSVHRSSKQIYAQIIDDVKGHTLASASSLDKDLRTELASGANTAAAAAVGKALAERAKAAGVTQVVSTVVAICFTAASRLLPTQRVRADWNSDRRSRRSQTNESEYHGETG